MRAKTKLGAIALVGAFATIAGWGPAQAEDTIKIGVLHSLSGTMAISETTLKDTVLMMVDDINKKGGLLGKKVEAVVVDPALELAALRREGARAAREGQGRGRVRLLDLGVAQIGAAGLRQGANGLLFYPVQYEGEESSKQRVLYRRRAEPAGDPRRRISDERGRRRGQALGARRHRLRLSAHHQQDPATPSCI